MATPACLLPGASRKLTARLKDATSVTELLTLLDEEVDGKIFCHFQASAAYHSLVMLDRKKALTKSEKQSSVLPRLAARVQEMVEKDQVEPRTVANVLWSLGQLLNRVPISKALLRALIKSTKKTASDMKPQEVTNCLGASLRLKDLAPNVLTTVPALAEAISSVAEKMSPQDVSNSMWASAHLKDDVDFEDVVKIVSSLAEQIPQKAAAMIPQHLSNSLWAAAHLKHATPQIKRALRAIIDQVPSKAKRMKPQELSNSVWAAARLKEMVPVRTMLPALAVQIRRKAQKMAPQALSNSLWAASRLKDDGKDEVLQMVPALLKELPQKEAKLLPQEFANSLEALIRLEDTVPEVATFLRSGSGSTFVRGAAIRFKTWLPKLKGKDLQLALPVVLWVCGKVGLYHEEFLASIASIFTADKGEVKLSSLQNWHLCAMLSSFRVLDPADEFNHFKYVLKSHIVQQGLGEFDINRSQFGPVYWT